MRPGVGSPTWGVAATAEQCLCCFRPWGGYRGAVGGSYLCLPFTISPAELAVVLSHGFSSKTTWEPAKTAALFLIASAHHLKAASTPPLAVFSSGKHRKGEGLRAALDIMKSRLLCQACGRGTALVQTFTDRLGCSGT